MTSGTIVVLGPTGHNFGAGMTGGVVNLYYRENIFGKRMNPQLVRAERIANDEDGTRLRDLVQQHADKTDSA